MITYLIIMNFDMCSQFTYEIAHNHTHTLTWTHLCRLRKIETALKCDKHVAIAAARARENKTKKKEIINQSVRKRDTHPIRTTTTTIPPPTHKTSCQSTSTTTTKMKMTVTSTADTSSANAYD